MRDFFYILKDGKPVQEPSRIKWAQWFEYSPNRIVRQETVGDLEVSTVFLGIDHRFSGEGPPILFETMVFGFGHGSLLEEEKYTRRYETLEQAKAGHAEIVDNIRGES